MGDQILSERVKQSVVAQDLFEEEDASVDEDSERLPFTDVNDVPHRNRRHLQKFGAFSVLDKENSPKGKMPARQRLKLNSFEIPAAAPHSEDSESASRSLPTTPTRELEEEEGETEPPLTPTANLKVLLKVVSPDLKKIDQERERQRQTEALQRLAEDSTDCADSADVFSSQESDTGKGPSRKEKSLGLLCTRFLRMYPEYPSSEEAMEISLDDVARTLNVERRRIYDIVNVLESVEMVSRVAKNKYAWHGKTNLTHTLAKLKALAEKEGFAEQIRNMKDSEVSQEPSGPIQCHLSGADSDPKAFLRKDKSLGIMSQKFLMLFLVSKPSTVNLDMSAKILIGDADYDKTETAKYKTKIRRLYDIANILTSLGLITKVYVTDLRGRKPAFQYIGPEIDKVSEVNVCCNEGPHRPSSRHSMLDCVRNEASESSLAHIISKYPRIQPAEGKQATVPPSFSKGASAEAEQRLGHRAAEAAAAAAARRMPRHSSFEQICRVAESERSKLYASTSEPSSPMKKLSFDEVSEDATSRIPAAQQPPKAKTAHMVKLPATVSEANKLKQYPIHLIQVTSGPSPARPMGLPGVKMGETFFIDATRSGVFTVDQVSALLRSITVPVPVPTVPTAKKVNRQVDASTQSSPSAETSGAMVVDRSEEERSASPLTVKVEVKMEVEDSQVAAKRPGAGEVESVEAKRPKLQLATPVTVEEDSMPSPCDSGRFSEESHGAFEVPSQEKSPPPAVNGSPPQLELEQPASPADSATSASSCSSPPTSEASSPVVPPQIHKVHQLPPGVRIIHTGGKPLLIQGSPGQLAAPMVCQLPMVQDAPPKSTVLVGVPATTAPASVARLVSQLTTAVPVTFSPPVQVPVTFSTLSAPMSNTFTFPSGVPRSLAPTHFQIIHPRQSTATSTPTTSSSFTTSPSSAFSPALGTLPPAAQPQGSQSQQLLSPTTTIGVVPSVLLSPPVTTRVPNTTRLILRQAKKLPPTPVSTITTVPTYLSPVTTGMVVPDSATPSQSSVMQAASGQQALTESTQKRVAEDGKGTSAASAAIRSALRNAVANRSSSTARKLPLCDPNS